MTGPLRVDRRRALALLGGAGVWAVAAACSSSSPDASSEFPAGGATTTAGDGAGGAGSGGGAGGGAASGAAPACTLTPEQTEGPYYLDLDLVRRDITEDRQGTSLRLAITVVDAASCQPVRDAAVDVWHADADGAYSGFGGGTGAKTAQGAPPPPPGGPGPGGQNPPVNDLTFLRGTQVTGSDGVATFTTIYPGWYPGRAVHIHVKVHAGGDVVHTGQLYFDPDVTTAAYRDPPYADRGEPDTPNERDGIFRQGGAATVMTPTKRGDAGGYRAAITLGIQQP